MKVFLFCGVLLGFAALAHAARDCPIVLLSGKSTATGISVTARNNSHFAIGRLAFNCAVQGRTKNEPPMRCNANSPMFFPGSEFTAEFYYPAKPKTVTLSVKALSQSNGFLWKPLRKDSCQTLTIAPPRKRVR